MTVQTDFVDACRRADAAFGYHDILGVVRARDADDPAASRSLIRFFGYVKERPYRQGGGEIALIETRPSSVVRPVTLALMVAATDPVPLTVGDPLVVLIATLVSYPDGPGPALPGVMQAQFLANQPTEVWERIKRMVGAKEPEVVLRGMILPAEEPAAIGPVPHVVRQDDELRFTVRARPFPEGNWPPITLPVRYKGERADHIYSRITLPEHPFVEVVGWLKSERDGPLRVQAQSIVGVKVMEVA